MLKSTFLHTPTVGPATESDLWRQGASDWYRFLADAFEWRISEMRRALLVETLEASVQALEERAHGYFARALPPAHRWRAFSEFSGSVGYLDIETTGTGAWDEITVIGLYDGEETHTFVKGHNLHRFAETLESCAMLVTYNGGSFDIPILKRKFPNAPFDERIHVDLCPALRRLGLRGGLKGVETALGIQRPDDLCGLSGWDAVTLWRRYRRGDVEALDTLVRYNREDVENLRPLMEHAYRELSRLTLSR